MLSFLTRYFNPRSPHGERREGTGWRTVCPYFNPRPPHGERRVCCTQKSTSITFQPTLPARGATRASSFRFAVGQEFQPTLPARGATYSCFSFCVIPAFQPTLPARGATPTSGTIFPPAMHFNPRSPHGERQYGGLAVGGHLDISTHAPRTGSDGGYSPCGVAVACDFNPRSPHGERHPPRRTP